MPRNVDGDASGLGLFGDAGRRFVASDPDSQRFCYAWDAGDNRKSNAQQTIRSECRV
jgi:hypothetical protein